MNYSSSGRADIIESLEGRTLFSTITVAPVVVTPGLSSQLATFTAVLDAPSATPIKVSFATAGGGTATPGHDFKATSGSIVIQPGQTSGTFSVKILPDTVFESNEIFFVNLRANGGNSITAQTSCTLIENSVMPSIVVSDSVIQIGLHRKTSAKLFVGLSGRSATPITVNFTTQDVTAVSGVDYVPVETSLVIPAFKTGASIPLTLIGTSIVVPDKVFDVDFTDATGAVVPAGLFSRIVIRDHGISPIVRPNLAISTPPVISGNPLNFVFTLSAPSANDVSFRYTTLPTSAQASQFTPQSGVLTIPAGQTTATISVPTVANTVSKVNVDTQLRLSLSAVANAQLATNDPIGTILAVPTIAISDATVDETGASPTLLPGKFFVTLNEPSTLPVSVTFNTANGTGDPTITELTDPAAAAAGIDYAATSGTLVFQPGQTSLPVSIPTLTNLNAAFSELYTINLSGAVNGVIGRQTGLGTINNLGLAVGTPQISIDNFAVAGDLGDPTFAVANGATGFLNFTISLGAPSSVPVSVHFATQNGTGAAGTDYTAKSGTVTFTPGQTNINVPVQVFGASPVAVDRTVLMVLSNPVGGVIAAGLGTGTGTIKESFPEISVNNAAVVVANRASTTLNFNISLAAAATVPVTVTFTTADGTGVAGTDYTATFGIVTFTPGQTSIAVPVTVFGVSLITVTKTVLLELSNPVAGVIAVGTGIGTITVVG
jgi:hypothetical protein